MQIYNINKQSVLFPIQVMLKNKYFNEKHYTSACHKLEEKGIK